MRAIVLAGAGGPEVLVQREVPRPVPGTREILVRVHATALNRADLLQRRGRYPAPPDVPADIPGMEFAGEVADAGPGTSLWSRRDRVFGIVGGGAYAEYLVTHERAVARVPHSLDWAAAASIPEAFITAHDALVTQADLRSGDRVLIHAVGSGVGLAAVQLVRALDGVPYGTSRTAEKIEHARSLGLEDGWVAGDVERMPEVVRAWTDGHGADIVLDLVGGDYVQPSILALAPAGRLMCVGTVAGREARLPLGKVLTGRLTIRGTVMRARPIEEKILATRAFAAQVLPLLEGGTLRAVIDSVYPLEGIREAHERLESNQTFGKVVVRVDAST